MATDEFATTVKYLHEKLILGCETCSPEVAQLHFEVLLDVATGCDPTYTDYILEMPGKCPMCGGDIEVKTLVEFDAEEGQRQTRVNRDLLLGFLLEFSKFEYALKATGVYKKGQSEATPDWDSFAVSLRHSFDQAKTPELHRACEYLWSYPPHKQVIVEPTGVAWQAFGRDPEATPNVETLLRAVGDSIALT